MAERLQVDVYGGKYTVIQEEEGGMTFLRHGEPWEADTQYRHLALILALAQEVDALRSELKIVQAGLDLERRTHAASVQEVDELRITLSVAEGARDGARVARDHAHRMLVEADREKERLKESLERVQGNFVRPLKARTEEDRLYHNVGGVKIRRLDQPRERPVGADIADDERLL